MKQGGQWRNLSYIRSCEGEWKIKVKFEVIIPVDIKVNQALLPNHQWAIYRIQEFCQGLVAKWYLF